MIKYYLLYLLFIIPSWIINAQVSINTKNPNTGALHIDSKGNNPLVATNSSSEDDVFISSQGQIGIGTVTPASQLHVVSNPLVSKAIMIEDGSQGYSKLFGSDSQGNGLWKYAGETQIARGNIGNGITVVANNYSSSTTFVDTGSYLDLPPGRWLVTATMKIMLTNTTQNNAAAVWARSTFSNTQGGLNSSDIIGARYISGLGVTATPNTLNGFIVIVNSSQTTKRYYYSVGWFTLLAGMNTSTVISSFAANTVNENNILAFKMSDI